MGSLKYDDQEMMVRWAEKRIGFPFRPDAKAIGWLGYQGDLKAVTVFDGFSPCDCNIHVASDGSKRWLTRGYLRAIFAYPFIQLGLRRVTGLVPARNEAALKLDLGLGFEREGYCRNALPDDDIVLLAMLRESCPFIPKEYRHA